MESEKLEKKTKPLTDQPASEAKNTTKMGEQPSFFWSGRLKSADITRAVVHYFRQNQYEQLKAELADRGFLAKDKIEKFFLKEGEAILYWALNADSDQPLRFLADENGIVPKPVLQTILKKNNFCAFRTFLYGQAGCEKRQRYTPALGDMQIKKFKLLLSIDRDIMKHFMQENSSNKYLLTDTMKANFAEAERQSEQETIADEDETPKTPGCFA